MRVLHLMEYNLTPTMTWLYNLQSHLTVDQSVYAKHYMHNNGYVNGINYVPNSSDMLEGASVPSIMNSFGTPRWRLKLAEWLVGTYSERISQVVRVQSVDLVHVHFANFAADIVDQLEKLNVPVVVSFYGLDYEYIPFRFPRYKPLYQRVFSCASIVIAEGDYGAKAIIRSGCLKEKVKVSKLGVVFGQIKKADRVKPSGQLKLVQVASFREKKGQNDALEALSIVSKECPNVHLTFAGPEDDGPVFLELKRRVALLGVEDKVTFVGGIESNMLYEFLSKFDVFIHPSRYASNRDCEGGAPIVILDAQATGMPVISTTHCDIPSEVVHNSTGLLTPEARPNELANSLRTFYKMDSKQYKSYRYQAREHVQIHYDIEVNIKHLENLYKLVLETRK
jgi:colanic acid/amylovoran biosynthesis glycosyltransferase